MLLFSDFINDLMSKSTTLYFLVTLYQITLLNKDIKSITDYALLNYCTPPSPKTQTIIFYNSASNVSPFTLCVILKSRLKYISDCVVYGFMLKPLHNELN